MSLNFGWKRSVVLVICLTGFAVFGGFDVHWIDQRFEVRVYALSVMAFVAGSVFLSVIDHSVGHMEPRTNLRGAYVVLGGLMMAGATWFLYASRG